MKSLVPILAAALLAGCGGRPVSQINVLHQAHNAMSQDTLNVNMGALHASRQWGSASIGDARHGVDVKIDIANEPPAAHEPAYIAIGTCAPPARKAWRPLQAVTRGKSHSYVPGIDIGAIKKGRYSIVVLDASHQPVSCGNFQI